MVLTVLSSWIASGPCSCRFGPVRSSSFSEAWKPKYLMAGNMVFRTEVEDFFLDFLVFYFQV
jgi:hypothetical protein